jgi:Fe-S cluster biogenesis protein NfuA
MTPSRSDAIVTDPGFQRRMEQIEALGHELERAPDPRLRDNAQELVRALMDLHKAALARVLDAIDDPDERADRTVERLAADELVGNVLLLHDLHPIDFDVRVRRAIDAAAERAKKHGAGIELVESRDRQVVVRIVAGSGCGSSADSLRQMVEEALYAHAPDLARLDFDAVEPSNVTFIPLWKLSGHRSASAPDRAPLDVAAD